MFIEIVWVMMQDTRLSLNGVNSIPKKMSVWAFAIVSAITLIGFVFAFLGLHTLLHRNLAYNLSLVASSAISAFFFGLSFSLYFVKWIVCSLNEILQPLF